MERLIDALGDTQALAALGLLVGLLFGIAAQRARFCLRAATVEVAHMQLGPRLAIWGLAFSTAVFGVQGLTALGVIELGETRSLAGTGSLSGAVIGGLMFGAGMILARGCASRLLVLASCGNLRALITGLVVTLVAQAAYRGILSPWRESIAGLWTVSGREARDLATVLSIDASVVTVIALALVVVAIAFARSRAVTLPHIIAGSGVGLAVTLGWWATYALAQSSFEILPVSSVTFTGPSTDTLLVLIGASSVVWSFGVGLVPGVALGAGLSAVAAKEWRIERFGPDTPMERYLTGAILMGFGAMLAGGCAVGAGLSGGAALSLTAWVAVASMWGGAIATERLMALRYARTAMV